MPNKGEAKMRGNVYTELEDDEGQSFYCPLAAFGHVRFDLNPPTSGVGPGAV